VTDAVKPGAPSLGWVHRAGGELTVAPPAEMPSATWRTLQQELLLHAEAVLTVDGALSVPVHQAHRLAEILARPWPAGRWPWDWSPSARVASARAVQLHDAYLRVLSSEEPTRDEIDAVLAEIRSGGFSRALLEAQEGAVTSLVRAEGGGNFSVPGSGKTTMTFAVYVALRERGAVDRMLVVAPQGAYEAWEEESQECFVPDRRPSLELAPRAPRRSTEVLVVNYERASQAAVRAAIHGWSRGHRLLVVFDEAHRAKRGSRGEHGRGALDLAELAERRLVLTGTPMPNGVEDLEAILDLAWPGHGRQLASSVTPGADRSWVRITKDQLELTPAELTVVPVHLDENHRRIYDAVVTGLAAMVDQLQARPEFASTATARLVAAASNPALLLDEADDRQVDWGADLPSGEVALSELIAELRTSVRPAKLLAAAASAREHAERGEKLLIWTNYIGNIRELERLLEPLNPAVITGAVTRDDPSAATDRVRELRKFREDATCSVLIATPQTLGEGVSLHHVCQSQVHVDRSFNAGLFLQSLDRTHRVGMPTGTTARVALLVAADTIDEAVNASLNRKLLDMDAKLRDATLRRLADPDLVSRALGAEEMAALVAHLR
jgi:superfamily II DNA or RNA helicase